MLLIKNVKIYTMEEKSPIENGYLCIDRGVIQDLGRSLPGQADYDEVIDGKGLVAIPGLIDAHSHLGSVGDSLGFESDDINEMSDPVTPFLSTIDSINPMDRCFQDAIMGGVTTVAAGPGSSNPIAGNIIILKTSGNRVDRMIVKSPAAMKMALGENPKSCYHAKNQVPETRMSTAAIIREYLQKAIKYSRDKEEAERDCELEEPDYDAKLEALIPVVKGTIPVHFHAHRADDIFTAIRIAKEFSLQYHIVHATDGALIADELREENASVLFGPILMDRSKPELKNLSPQTCEVLEKAGVSLSLVTDHPVIPAQYLLTCACLAHKEGMSSFGALRAVTLNPAKALGIDDRLGSLKPGKSADIVLLNGDPLDFYAKVKLVLIDGKIVYKE